MVTAITLQKRPTTFGESLGIGHIDHSFFILNENVIIGHVHVNMMIYGKPFIEWVELYPDFQDNHLFRPILTALFNHYIGATRLCFDAIEKNWPMYDHLGAVRIEYDEIREVMSYELPRAALC